MVVISRGRPETALRDLGCQEARRGIYRALPGLALCVVVLSELPRTRETLLLRLLGSGAVLGEALSDLSALPDDAWEKGVATPLLLHFQFEVSASSADEEVGMSPEIQAWYEEYKAKLRAEGAAEARAEALERGRHAGERALLLRLLRARFGDLPAAVTERIDGAESAQIEQWGERVLFASTLDEVFQEPAS